jgi:hypothetical protein
MSKNMNNRRDFIKKIGLSSAALIFAEKIYADPYAPIPVQPGLRNIVRITGYVKAGNKAVKNVLVSDGSSVVKTDNNGYYTLITDTTQKFVFVSLPSGYKVPVNETGTAKFFHEIMPGKDEQEIHFELVPQEQPDNEHSFLVLADPQTLDMNDINLLNTETVPDVKKAVSGISHPVFGISCGDIMFDNLDLYPQYENAVKNMQIPFFQVFGNHDAEVLSKTDELSVRTFEKHFGPNYYSFNKGEIHYIVLDDVFWFGGYIGYIAQQQLSWLENDLQHIEKGSTVVVFAHIPFYSEQHIRLKEGGPSNTTVVTNRELLFKILEPYKSYLICGHTHESEFLNIGNAELHVGGAVCGAWWTGPICIDGTPNGYSVYTVKGNDLSWKYKSTGKEFDHQMRLYRKGNEVIANVWNANKNWKVILHSGGDKKTMKQIMSTDPLAEELYAGEDKPNRHSWVDPMPANHLYTAEIPSGGKEITVEAFDTWGRTYTEKLII